MRGSRLLLVRLVQDVRADTSTRSVSRDKTQQDEAGGKVGHGLDARELPSSGF